MIEGCKNVGRSRKSDAKVGVMQQGVEHVIQNQGPATSIRYAQTTIIGSEEIILMRPPDLRTFYTSQSTYSLAKSGLILSLVPLSSTSRDWSAVA